MCGVPHPLWSSMAPKTLHCVVKLHELNGWSEYKMGTWETLQISEGLMVLSEPLLILPSIKTFAALPPKVKNNYGWFARQNIFWAYHQSHVPLQPLWRLQALVSWWRCANKMHGRGVGGSHWRVAFRALSLVELAAGGSCVAERQ